MFRISDGREVGGRPRLVLPRSRRNRRRRRGPPAESRRPAFPRSRHLALSWNQRPRGAPPVQPILSSLHRFIHLFCAAFLLLVAGSLAVSWAFRPKDAIARDLSRACLAIAKVVPSIGLPVQSQSVSAAGREVSRAPASGPRGKDELEINSYNPNLSRMAKISRHGPRSIGAIVRAAKRWGVDPEAMVAVAVCESGLNPGKFGDYKGGQATSFGLFQLHREGMLPQGWGPDEACVPERSAEIAARSFALAGGVSLKGRAAIELLVRHFERPRYPDAEIDHACEVYRELVKGSPGRTSVLRGEAA